MRATVRVPPPSLLKVAVPAVRPAGCQVAGDCEFTEPMPAPDTSLMPPNSWVGPLPTKLSDDPASTLTLVLLADSAGVVANRTRLRLAPLNELLPAALWIAPRLFEPVPLA